MSHRTPIVVCTAMIFASVTGLLMLIEARIGAFTGPLSRPLREHSQLWAFTFSLTLGTGIWLLWNRTHSHTAWRPRYGGCRFRNAVLYTRDGCHLCDEAAALLARYRRWLPAVTEVDIDLDPELQARLGTEIPVIQFDGKTRFKGRISEFLLQRLIDGTPPLA